MDSRDLERAWKYHDAADQLLSGRMQSFLITQAFLIVGYAQILTAQNFENRFELKLALATLSLFAIILTIIMRSIAAELSRGLRKLKNEYLLDSKDGDEVYKTYIIAVKGDKANSKSTFEDHARSWTRGLPNSFLVFWLLSSAYAIYSMSEFFDFHFI